MEVVGSYKANKWGLYDMLGNVWEWCIDREYYNEHEDNAVDPVGSRRSGNQARHSMIRGASFGHSGNACSFCVCTHEDRGKYYDDYGFRVCLNIIPWDGWQNPQQAK